MVIKFGSQIMLVVAISGVGAGFLGLYAVHIMINLLALFADRVTSYPFEFRPEDSIPLGRFKSRTKTRQCIKGSKAISVPLSTRGVLTQLFPCDHRSSYTFYIEVSYFFLFPC